MYETIREYVRSSNMKYFSHMLYIIQRIQTCTVTCSTCPSRIIGAVRGAHSQLWGTIIPVCSPYALHKYDKRFGTPAIV